MKLNIRICMILGFIMLLFAIPAYAAAQTGRVTGTVLYEDGTKAANVVVQMGIVNARTDANGKFTLQQVIYGDQRLTVLAEGKSQTIKQVALRTSEMAVGDIIIPIVPAGNLFLNPTFADAEIILPPPAWTIYGTHAGKNTITLVDADDPYNRGLRIVDGETEGGWAAQIGLRQDVAAKPNQSYRLTARIKAVHQASIAGANLQLRFLPSGKIYQVPLEATSTNEWVDVWVEGLAPADTTTLRVNLWSTYEGTPQYIIRQLTVVPVTR